MTPEEEKYLRISFYSLKSNCCTKTNKGWEFTMETWLTWWDALSPELRSQRVTSPRTLIPDLIDKSQRWSPDNIHLRAPKYGNKHKPREPMQMEKPVLEPIVIRKLSVKEWIAELRGVAA